MPEPHAVPETGLFLHQAKVRAEWVDYNGHMNEAYYVLIFGDATDALYDHIGFDDHYRRAGTVSTYTLESHIRYLVEAHEGDLARIETRVVAHDEKRARIYHAMWRENVLLAVIELLVLHVDKTVLRASAFAPEILARISAIALQHKGLTLPEPAQSRFWLAAAAQG